MYLPATISDTRLTRHSLSISFDVSGREVVLTCSTSTKELRSIQEKIAWLTDNKLALIPDSFLGLKCEVNVIDVKTKFGDLPAITDIRKCR